ncbi:YtxH domain-containing protein [Plectonema radiosum NIES-515]|jgi:gas vesicle protein|uniref:YtxH domain-containing protein n=1 Tax=Plectonema radiosum NIES-515 TaxID=2986073 RepID=A0ABT3B3A7_9CYAN|nr:YtxH domain-containing protein [Plectonema radiosum]MCV3215349.1 YtxH domain-containing protein [Plectonema radiosum NIES-515]
MSTNNRSGVFIGGLMLGATIGALTGLLAAPRTGRETRKILKKSADALPELAEDLSTTVQIQADRLSTSAMKNWDETLDRLRDAIASGIDATVRESQVLKQKSAQENRSAASVQLENSDSRTSHLDRP